MPEIPESLLRRSAEAKAKALGIPVEQVLAEMRGEATPQEETRGRRTADGGRRDGNSGRDGGRRTADGGRSRARGSSGRSRTGGASC